MEFVAHETATPPERERTHLLLIEDARRGLEDIAEIQQRRKPGSEKPGS